MVVDETVDDGDLRTADRVDGDCNIRESTE
jgi:hypothetical protein